MKAYVINADYTPKDGYVLNQREIETHRAMRGNMIWKNVNAGLIEISKPEIKSDEVLIKVGACGVCGSDLHMIEMGEDHYTLFPGHTKFPVISGHEFSGEVVEIGSDVKSVQVGDLIAVEQIQWCGKCDACRIGKFNQCRNLEEVGITRNGGFCEYSVVNEKFCCKINDIAERYGDKMTALELGALAEPTCVVYSGMIVNAGGVRPGGYVAVFGAGPIGLAAINVARACGAASIFAFDTVTEKLELAKIAGADYTYNSIELSKKGSAPSEVVMEMTKGIGASMIVEAAGAFPKTYPEIAKSIAIGGKVVQLGMQASNAPVDMTAFQVKNASIQGSLGHAGSDIYPSVLRMMAAGRLDMRTMVTARYSLDNIAQALKTARLSGSGKVLVSQHYK